MLMGPPLKGKIPDRDNCVQSWHSHLKLSSGDNDIGPMLRGRRGVTWGGLAIGRGAVHGHQLEGPGELLCQLLSQLRLGDVWAWIKEYSQSMNISR